MDYTKELFKLIVMKGLSQKEICEQLKISKAYYFKLLAPMKARYGASSTLQMAVIYHRRRYNKLTREGNNG